MMIINLLTNFDCNWRLLLFKFHHHLLSAFVENDWLFLVIDSNDSNYVFVLVDLFPHWRYWQCKEGFWEGNFTKRELHCTKTSAGLLPMQNGNENIFFWHDARCKQTAWGNCRKVPTIRRVMESFWPGKC